MKLSLLDILRCPNTNTKLVLEKALYGSQSNHSSINDPLDGANSFCIDEVESGTLVSEDGQYTYEVLEGVPRFVQNNNYAASFGMQWNLYPKTQLDSYSGHDISANRFWNSTGWNQSELKNKFVLDVGCGSGRFAEIALNAGAIVVALDYSNAVDACNINFLNHPNLHVVQGDIYKLPFRLESFSYIYSLGVLQHTPDPKKAFSCLPRVLKKEGKICVDFYEKSLKSIILPKYWLRPLTKRLPSQKLFIFLKKIIPFLLSLSLFVAKLPLLGNIFKKIIPVVNYHGILPLSHQQHLEWALLDTFDWLSPEHDHPQTSTTVKQWMSDASLRDIEVFKAGHLISRGKK
jgi:ubiquinone/menaquinone biosynthesis C-methylase UbiE/uncharacterized protein YbaR (Trm112 family)